MASLVVDQLAIILPRILNGLLVTGLLSLLWIGIFKLPGWARKLQTWRRYCSSHSKFGLEAGQGKYKWLEDPWSKAPNYWLCRHEAIKYVFSRAAIPETDHRAGFDWFHYAGWEIPTLDPRYKATVRVADQTVHGRLAKSRLAALLEAVKTIGFGEVQRIREAVGPEGRVVSLHTLMYRLGYNVNCIGIFGPKLDHVATRVTLQNFTEYQHMLFYSFNWPLPLWLSTQLSAGARRTVKARKELYGHLFNWYKSGGVEAASPEMQAIVQVFEEARSPPDISSKFLNMMMIAFLANTPETLGWLFTHLVQAPALLAAVRAECDALHAGGGGGGGAGPVAGEGKVDEEVDYDLHSTNFKRATPHLHSAFFETFRLYVFTGTPATVVSPCTLPGMGDHVFRPGDILHSMGEAAGQDVGVYGDDARVWKGHRFVGEAGEGLLKYDLTFGTGRSPCPGRNFAIAELCMLAARMVHTFDFSEPHLTERLRFDDGDWAVGRPAAPPPALDGGVDIVDLDGTVRRIVHPGNASDHGPPGMTAANIPKYDFACKLTPRRAANTA